MNSLTSSKKTILNFPRPYRLKWSRAAVPVLSAALLFMSCGIPQVSYIYPADNDIVRASGNFIFSFDHDIQNGDTIFEGYRFFYKFFSFSDYEQATQAQDTGDFSIYLENRESQDLEYSDIKNETYEDNGYHILYISETGSTVEPVFRLEIPEDSRDALLSFSINFSDPRNPYLSYTLSEITYRVFRYAEVDPSATGDTSDYLSFIPEDFIAGQGDLPDELFLEPPNINSFYIALYVVPYGSDENFIYNYGEARTLGYISLQFRI